MTAADKDRGVTRWQVKRYADAERVIVAVADTRGGGKTDEPRSIIVRRPTAKKVAKATARLQRWCDEQNAREVIARRLCNG
jgi:ABC-type nitrate/sulfonate/bicarbonate transport system substrate-binding protein